MTSIVDKSGETIAYLYQNIILDIRQEKVIGLILGNCLFGKKNSPIGKYFNDTFRKKNGKIIAKLGKDTSSKKPKNEPEIHNQAWQILSRMKDHVCIWIEEKDNWTKDSFLEFITQD